MTYDVGTGSSFVPFFTLFTLNHTSYTPPELQGKLYTWGGGTYGKLGQMDKVNSLTPRPVKNVTTGAHFVQVRYSAPGIWHSAFAFLALGHVHFTVGTGDSALNTWRLTFGIWHRAYGAVHLIRCPIDTRPAGLLRHIPHIGAHQARRLLFVWLQW